jgi:spermidine/putrescine transport system ATP-binding protein
VGENNRIEGKVVSIDANQVSLDCGDLGLLSGVSVHRLSVGEHALLFIRPELLNRRTTISENCFTAQVQELSFEGAYLMMEATPLNAQSRIRAQLLSDVNIGDLAIGNQVIFGFNSQDAIIMAAKSDV